MAEKILCAVCEMTSTDEVQANAEQLFSLFEQALSEGAKWISFPENCLYLRIDESQDFYGLSFADPVFKELASRCRQAGVAVHLGSVPLQDEDGRIWNSSILVDEQGSIERLYDKMHLFDIELPGHRPIKESDYYCRGGRPRILDWQGFRWAQSICYDLRFSELYYHYVQEKSDVVLVPAAFLPSTGEAHWEILLRARAIETQSFVLAAAQQGEHVSRTGARRKTHGQSMIVDPWGRVLAQASSQQRVISGAVSREEIEKVRQQMPMESHRRLSFTKMLVKDDG